MRPYDGKNQKTAWSSWIPILPLLGWYWSSLVFLAQVLAVPGLLAGGAEGQVAGRALHWHRSSRLARCDVAHCLAVSCGAPRPLGVQVDFWNAREREIKLYAVPLLFQWHVSRYTTPNSAQGCGSQSAPHPCPWAFGPSLLQAGLNLCSAKQLHLKHCNNRNTLHRMFSLPLNRETQNMNLTAACWEARIFCNTRPLHVFHLCKPCCNFRTVIKLMSSHFPCVTCLVYSLLSINCSSYSLYHTISSYSLYRIITVVKIQGVDTELQSSPHGREW